MRSEFRILNSEVKDSGKLRAGSSLTPDFSLGILVVALLAILPALLFAQPEPATSKSQVAGWEQLKYGMFIHFNMNTYAGAEYDNGKMPAEGFNPDQLDVDQWIRTARDAGMKYAVLTAKHTGGFCLWDSKVTWKGKEYDYDIASSGYKKDIVAQFMESCHKYNIKPGLYYCLWDDHNQPVSSKDEYFQLTRDHITELVTNYKGLVELWIDIPGILEPVQRAELYAIAKTHQPECMVTCNNGFTDGSVLYNFPADITNGERTLPPVSGHNPNREVKGKKYYIPMEVCQTINQNWFWFPNDVIKSVRTLYYWYDQTVKRGANLLLDVPPDRSGRIPQSLAVRLVELRKVIEKPETLPPPGILNAYKPVKASSVWGNNRVEYLPDYAVDADPNTRWLAMTDDPEPGLTVDLGSIKRFNSLVIMEPYEAHIGDYEVLYQLGDQWITLLKGNGIGSYLLRQFPAVESRMLRLVIKNYKTGRNPANVNSFPNTPAPLEGATIAEFQLFIQEEQDDPEYFNSFQPGREYFFLRSGKTQFIMQTDRSGTAPAFTWMIFNAEIPAQSVSKLNALNYSPGSNFRESALEVILGKVPFTALPVNSEVRWILLDSLPAVQCTWWAGGVRVTETFRVSDKQDQILRTIAINSADLAGDDSVRIRLNLPKGYIQKVPSGLMSSKPTGSLAVSLTTASAWITDEENGYMESPFMPIAKNQTLTIETSLSVNFPPDSANEPVTYNNDSNNRKLSTLKADDSLIQSLYRNASFALPGMVHNRREFWERTFSDAYELAYQTYMIQGLRDAADLSGILGVPEKADYWKKEADVFLNAMLHHPTRLLVDQGAFIKRRNVNGEIADVTVGRQDSYKYDAPLPTEYNHRLNPDATYALPILLGIIDPLVRNSSLDISRGYFFCGKALARRNSIRRLSDYQAKSLSGNKNGIGQPPVPFGSAEHHN
ncbi:MAG: hypothetical protein D4R64_18355 [Porphyromonadaceae bacterium]|nr:MAG: hypothetical protein D4R64_18355 [Porphyromonadaceae bacterium]